MPTPGLQRPVPKPEQQGKQKKQRTGHWGELPELRKEEEQTERAATANAQHNQRGGLVPGIALTVRTGDKDPASLQRTGKYAHSEKAFHK